jgi:hypothetical protein
MSASEFEDLAERIRLELVDIERVLKRISDILEQARHSNDDYYLDATALNLHGFYSGTERVLTLIAETVEGSIPNGDSWHLLLLQQMAEEIPNVRPAVISEDTFGRLDEYRRFRHVVRNVYTYNLDPTKLEKLVSAAPAVFAQFQDEVLTFALFLEEKK